MVHPLPVRALTAEAFAPCGVLMAVPDRAPVSASSWNAQWPLEFACAGRTELAVVRFPYQPIRFSLFERHHHVTQCFVLLAGQPAILVAAPPTPGRDRPAADAVLAFRMEPGQGIMFHRGAWHTLARFPVAPPDSTALMVTERETSEEFGRVAPGEKTQRTDFVDLKALDGIEFEVDPAAA